MKKITPARKTPPKFMVSWAGKWQVWKIDKKITRAVSWMLLSLQNQPFLGPDDRILFGIFVKKNSKWNELTGIKEIKDIFEFAT